MADEIASTARYHALSIAGFTSRTGRPGKSSERSATLLRLPLANTPSFIPARQPSRAEVGNYLELKGHEIDLIGIVAVGKRPVSNSLFTLTH